MVLASRADRPRLAKPGVDEQLRQAVLGAQGAHCGDIVARILGASCGRERFDEQQAGLQGRQRASGRVNPGEQHVSAPARLLSFIAGVTS